MVTNIIVGIICLGVGYYLGKWINNPGPLWDDVPDDMDI